MTGRRSPHLTGVERSLRSWGRPELQSLVKELYDHYVEARSFLAARLLRDSLGQRVLDPCREQIANAFYTKGICPDPSWACRPTSGVEGSGQPGRYS